MELTPGLVCENFSLKYKVFREGAPIFSMTLKGGCLFFTNSEGVGLPFFTKFRETWLGHYNSFCFGGIPRHTTSTVAFGFCIYTHSNWVCFLSWRMSSTTHSFILKGGLPIFSLVWKGRPGVCTKIFILPHAWKWKLEIPPKLGMYLKFKPLSKSGECTQNSPQTWMSWLKPTPKWWHIGSRPPNKDFSHNILVILSCTNLMFWVDLG